MTAKWPLIRLGELLTHRNEFITIDDTREYKRCKVQLHAQGIILRDIVPGYEIKTKKQQVCKTDDFLVAEIDAKVGGYGIVPEDLEGAIVSSHYFLYSIRQGKLLPRYLSYFAKTPYFHNQVAAQGSTNYAAIKSYQVLDYIIPLPPLPEQHRLVERIEAIVGKINEAKRLREEAQKAIDALVDAKLRSIINESNKKYEWDFGPISKYAEINPSRQGQIKVADKDVVSFVPMSAVDDIAGTIKERFIKPYYEVSKGYTWFREGDVIFARITPCMENGKSAVAVNLNNGHGFGSTEFHVLRPGTKILADWLHLLIRSKDFRRDAESYFKGTAGQQRIPQSFLEKKEIPVPPIPKQRELINYFKKFTVCLAEEHKIDEERHAELNALFPSVLDKAFKGES